MAPLKTSIDKDHVLGTRAAQSLFSRALTYAKASYKLFAPLVTILSRIGVKLIHLFKLYRYTLPCSSFLENGTR